MDSSLFIGVDIGGTHLRTALVDETGQIHHRTRTTTGIEAGPDAVLERLAAACRDLMKLAEADHKHVHAIGLGVAGKIDRIDGSVVFSPHLQPLNGYPLARNLVQTLGLPVVMENDCNAFGLGEAWKGSGQGIENWVGLTLGTGVGGVLILSGQLWTGDNLGFEAEIGHMIVDPHGPPCACGLRGCLEAHASASALCNGVKRAVQTGTLESGPLFDLLRSGQLTSESVYRCARSGESLATALFQRMGWALGLALASLFTVLGIRHAVIGGGVSHAWDQFIDPLWKTLRQSSSMLDAETAVIRRAKLGDDAAPLGAAYLAFSESRR
ncbi:MAG: ROK family protein [Syntrophobacteraceae bacterium]